MDWIHLLMNLACIFGLLLPLADWYLIPGIITGIILYLMYWLWWDKLYSPPWLDLQKQRKLFQGAWSSKVQRTSVSLTLHEFLFLLFLLHKTVLAFTPAKHIMNWVLECTSSHYRVASGQNVLKRSVDPIISEWPYWTVKILVENGWINEKFE